LVGDKIIGVLKDSSFEHPSAAIEPFVFASYTALRGTAVRIGISNLRCCQSSPASPPSPATLAGFDDPRVAAETAGRLRRISMNHDVSEGYWQRAGESRAELR
jgi:hypothetical protein